MNLNDYLEKLRSKPVHERQRIAVIATGVAFSVIFLIWVVSFSEMNRSVEKESNSASVSDQLEEMKNGMEENGQSIEEMMQGLSAEELGAEENITEEGMLNQETEGAQSEGTAGNQSQDTNSSQDNQREIPQLP